MIVKLYKWLLNLFNGSKVDVWFLNRVCIYVYTIGLTLKGVTKQKGKENQFYDATVISLQCVSYEFKMPECVHMSK